MDMNDLNTTDLNASTVEMIVTIIPLIYVLTVFIWIYYLLTGKKIDNYKEYGDEPKEILQKRYALGEIGSLEYLERMSRL